MRNPGEIDIKEYNYPLPEELIAQFPLEKRDDSRLLIYRNGEINETVFNQLPWQLPEGSLLVFNNTRVVHARLPFRKPTGAAIEVFCLEPANGIDVQLGMQARGQVRWNVLIGNARAWKSGVLSLPFEWEGQQAELRAERLPNGGEDFQVLFSWDPASLSFAEVLEAAGKMPLPPYMKRNSEEQDEDRYQTIYAKQDGAVAAPTAGLHFTAKVFTALDSRNIRRRNITLHVGAGTFKPVKADKIAEHEMHAEEIYIEKDLIAELLLSLPNPIVAVGTTSMRTLESLYWIGAMLIENPGEVPSILPQWYPYEATAAPEPGDALKAILQHLETQGEQFLHARTQILIAPGYEFKICTGLITNFHQPQSTLLLLISAFIGDDWKKVYEYALKNKFRFLSYGDSSLLWRKG